MKPFVLSLFAFLIVTPASAENLICDHLKTEAGYKDEKSYKFLFEAKDEFVFRSKKDLKEKFVVKPDTVENFRALTAAFKSQGIDLVITMPPTRGLTHFDKLPGTIEQAEKPFNAQAGIESYNAFLKQMKDAGVLAADFTGMT